LSQEDLLGFDEGIYNRIKFLTDPELTVEQFEAEEETFTTRLSDGTLIELTPQGLDKKVSFSNRFEYLEKMVKLRLSESDWQISAIKDGLCKIIPEPVLKCKKILI
jgi:hypothetical protein